MSSRALHLVHGPRLRATQSVSVAFGSTASELLVRMEVRGFEPFVQPDLGPPGSGPHWGLWESDVVEVFIAEPGGRVPYCEYQISPLGQYFELEVLEPRKKINRDYRSGGKWSAKRVGENGWDALFRIPWNVTDAPTFLGNIFAILGQGAEKRHFSLFTPPQAEPDFHLPELFSEISVVPH